MSRSTTPVLLVLAFALVSMALACSSPPAEDGTTGDDALVASGTCTPPVDPGDQGVNILRDVPYARLGGQPLYLDIAWPKGGGVHPLVVAIHGGGWKTGDKSDLTTDIRKLAARGYVAASLDYRLLDTACPADGGACTIACTRGTAGCNHNAFPAQIEDVRCSVRWLRANAATYGIDKTRVAAFGRSAGGHLASLLGSAAEVTELDGAGACPSMAEDVSVRAVVAYYPPVDLGAYDTTTSLGRGMPSFLGITSLTNPTQGDQDLLDRASPSAHIDSADPAVLLIQGTVDTTVPPSTQVEPYFTKLQNAHVRSALVEIPGYGHGFSTLSSASALAPSTCRAMTFLANHL